MLPDGRYVTDEDAAKQIKVTPITFRRWLAVGTMPQFRFGGTAYVLQSDVDDFVEACQCRNQRKVYEPKLVETVAS
jgi:excisionase family DNA binding protein